MYSIASNKLLKVLVFQPSVPNYRLPFFLRLSEFGGISMTVFAGEDSLTADSLRTDKDSVKFDYKVAPISGYFANKLFWQLTAGVERSLDAGDVVVLCGNPRFLSNYKVIYNARRLGAGVVWWGHGWTAGSSWFSSVIRRFLMKHLADTILLYTDAEVQRFKELGFDETRLFATNNALDQNVALTLIKKWSKKALLEFKKANNLQSENILLFCGRLTKKAELGFLINQIPEIIKKIPNLKLVVIGEGQESNNLKKLSTELGLDHHISWLGAIYVEKDLAPWFLISKAFVYPGSIGLSLLHAMGYGLPVITHAEASMHMPEFAALENGKNALTFNRGDKEDFINKVLQILSNGAVREALSKGALETVTKKYSIEQMVVGFLDAVNKASKLKLIKQ